MPWTLVALVVACLSSACDRGHDAPAAAAPEASSASPPVPPPPTAPWPFDAAPSAAIVSPIATPPATVENIGMHIGGGPNDAATKAPIAGSVAPHFAELAACWTQVADPARAGDFGVDLLIPREGGLASVTHPRTSLGPDAFRDCVTGVFSRVEFARPLTGRTTVSYSLRFTPSARPSQ